MGRKAKDITGNKYGRLTAMERDMTAVPAKNSKWICKCDCGNIISTQMNDLASGKVMSCGCLKNEIASHLSQTYLLKHGLADTKLYNVWKQMRQRCQSKSNKSYINYGGRGISVCDEWNHDFRKFSEWSFSNGYDGKLSIDRINNDGNYEPSNCRWATRHEQNMNKRPRTKK